MRVEAGQRMRGGIRQHVGFRRGQRVRGEGSARSPGDAGPLPRAAATPGLLLALHIGIQVALCIQAAHAVQLLVVMLGCRRFLLLLLPLRRGGAACFPLRSCQVISIIIIHALQQLTCPVQEQEDTHEFAQTGCSSHALLSLGTSFQNRSLSQPVGGVQHRGQEAPAYWQCAAAHLASCSRML